MMLSLFEASDPALAVVRDADAELGFPSRLARAWLAFHREHPWVYELFVRFSREAVGAGRRRFGAKAIAERVRWEVGTRGPDRAGFKLNNNFPAYYARLVARVHPELAALFVTRRLGGGDHVVSD